MTLGTNLTRLFTWASSLRKPFRKVMKGRALFAPMADDLEARRLMTLNVFIDANNQMNVSADDNLGQYLDIQYDSPTSTYTVTSQNTLENFAFVVNTPYGLTVTKVDYDSVTGNPAQLTIQENLDVLNSISIYSGEGRDFYSIGYTKATVNIGSGGGSDQFYREDEFGPLTRPDHGAVYIDGGTGDDTLSITTRDSGLSTVQINQNVYGVANDLSVYVNTSIGDGNPLHTQTMVTSLLNVENVNSDFSTLTNPNDTIGLVLNGSNFGSLSFPTGSLAQTGLKQVNVRVPDTNQVTTSVYGYSSDDSMSVTRTNVGFKPFVGIQSAGLPATNLYGFTNTSSVLRMFGLGGNDSIKVASGVEDLTQIQVDGGDGNDYLSADATIIGGAGNDTLVGGVGNDSLDGGEGNNTFLLSGGDDTLVGGTGFDNLALSGTVGASNIFSINQDNGVPATILVNGIFSTLTMTEIDQISVLGSIGNDDLFVNNNATTPVPVVAFMGAGEDSTYVTDLANAQFVTTYGESGFDHFMATGGHNKFFGGDDADVFYDYESANSFNQFDGGSGQNLLLVVGSQVRVKDDGILLSIFNGLSDQTLAINVTSIQISNTVPGSGNYTLSADQGDKTILVADSNTNPSLNPGDVQVSGLRTSVLLSGITAGDLLNISGNAGNDSFNALGSSDATVNFIGGAGDDSFNVTQESSPASFSGGTGADRVNVYGTPNADLLDFEASGLDEAINYNGVLLGTIVDADILNVASFAGNDGIIVGSIGTGTGLGGFNLSGGEGNDFIQTAGLTTGTFNIQAGEGNDTVFGPDATAVVVIYGGGGDDQIVLGSAESAAYGEAGNDKLHGGASADTLSGGDGIDYISGGLSADMIDGGAGDDVVAWSAGDGADTITGGTGLNVLLVQGDPVVGNSFTLEPQALNGTLFEVLIAGQVINAGSFTQVSMTGGSGSDNFNIGDLTGTGITLVNTDFGIDSVADMVTVNGTSGDDRIYLLGDSAVAEVTGLPWVVRAENSGFSATTLVDGILIDGSYGYDWIWGTFVATAPVLITLKGGLGVDFLQANSPALGDNPVRTTIIANDDFFIDTIFLNNGRNLVQGGTNDQILVDGTENIDTITLDGVTTPGRVNFTVNGLTSSNDLSNFSGVINVNALGGNDTVTVGGYGLPTSIFGGLGNDVINASGMTVAISLYGGEGDDSITGGFGNDNIDGGNGWNTLAGGMGVDVVNGGAGTDEFDWNSGDGFDYFTGYGGEDYIVANGGAGGANAFQIARNGTNYTMHYNGNLNQGFEADQVPYSYIVAGAGSAASATVANLLGINISRIVFDFSLAATSSVSVNGTSGADNINVDSNPINPGLMDVSGLPYQFRVLGTPTLANNSLTINGLGGDDIMSATSAASALSLIALDGGDGNDILSADATLLGGSGDDKFIVPVGVNVIDGGTGFNQIVVSGTDGNDTIGVTQGVGTVNINVNGITSTNTVSNIQLVNISALAGNDTVTLSGAGTINTYVYAGYGNDNVDATGLAASVSLYGASGDDSLAGGSGNDYLDGGDGSNRLAGGLGNDSIVGGANGDVVIYNAGDGLDTIDGGGGVNNLYVYGLATSNNTINVNPNALYPTDISIDINGLTRAIDAFSIQGLILTGGTASDTFNIGDLTGRSVTYVSTDFGVDTVADNLTVTGTANDDQLRVTGSTVAQVVGLSWTVSVSNSAMNGPLLVDGITVDAGTGWDFIGVIGDLFAPVLVTLIGGRGADTMVTNAPAIGVNPYRVTVDATGGAFANTIYLWNGRNRVIGTADDVIIAQGTANNDTVSISQTIEGTVISVNSHASTNDLSQFLGVIHVDLLGGNDTATLNGYTIPTSVMGGDGNDSIDASGTTVPVTLYGGSGDDILKGGSATDYIEGNDGVDVIFGSAGSDLTYGGADIDTFIWSFGNGNNSFDGGTGQNFAVINGDPANGNLFTMAPESSFPSSVKIDVANSGGVLQASIHTASVQQINLAGGTGQDTFNIGNLSGTAVTTVITDFGVDTVADKLNVKGTANSDAIIVSGLVDAKVTGLPWEITAVNAKMDGNLLVDGVAVDGGLGDDNMRSSSELTAMVSVTLIGGLGADTLASNTGVMGVNPVRVTLDAISGLLPDTIYLGNGRNRVLGTLDDVIQVDGTVNNDTVDISQTLEGTLIKVNGRTSTNDLSAYLGVIHVDLQGGNDTATLSGYTIPTSVQGGDGNDLIDASLMGTSVTISGGAGNDTLHGSAFGDQISGDAGNDDIYGNAGNDTLSGGDGNDDFFWASNGGLDHIDGGQGNDWAGFIGSTTTDNAFTLTPLTSSATPSTAAGVGSGDANRVLVTNLGADSAHIGDVESVSLYGGSGCDTFGIGNLQTTSLRVVDVFFSTNATGGVVSTYATNLPDTITVTADASNQIGVNGLAIPVRIFNTKPTMAIVVHAGFGADTIEVDPIAETQAIIVVDGGSGNDIITGGSIIIGGPGNNLLIGTDGPNTIIGGTGADTIQGLGGNDLLFGDAQVTGLDQPGKNCDYFAGLSITPTTTGAPDLIDGGDGDDTINGNIGDDSITGGQGNDQIGELTYKGVFFPEAGNDQIDGGDGNNCVFSGDGNDKVVVGSGNNLLVLGAGNDTANTGNGNNTVFAGAGDDIVNTGSGNDVVALGAGNDTATLGDGNDLAWGEDGTDFIIGAMGNDTIYGGNGNDTLWGGTQATKPVKNSSQVVTKPDDGADVLAGEDGFDQLDGGTGNNIMDAGADNIRETMVGSGGWDTAYIHKNEGKNQDVLKNHTSRYTLIPYGSMPVAVVPATPTNCDTPIQIVIPNPLSGKLAKAPVKKAALPKPSSVTLKTRKTK